MAELQIFFLNRVSVKFVILVRFGYVWVRFSLNKMSKKCRREDVRVSPDVNKFHNLFTPKMAKKGGLVCSKNTILAVFGFKWPLGVLGQGLRRGELGNISTTRQKKTEKDKIRNPLDPIFFKCFFKR